LTLLYNYNQLLQLITNLDRRGLSPFYFSFYDWLQSQSQSHIATDGQSVSLGVETHLGLMTRYLLQFDSYGSFLWGALSDERTGLSFVYASGPCHRSVSRVRFPWDLRPYFTVSHLRLPFSSPPTTRRITLEVFNPASWRQSPSLL
jgi:hypothetical protein